MALLAQDMSRVLIQGITGATGTDFAQSMTAAGDFLVAGVTPGRGGERVCDLPVFDSVEEAVAATAATASLLVVPPWGVLDAVSEAAAAGIRLASVYTENVPVHDALAAIAIARTFGMRLIGPNAAGIASPGVANLSDIRDDTLVSGPVGIASKSGTLVYEVIDGLSHRGVGVSSVVCLGGDGVVGTSLADALRLFAADDRTEAIVLIGEIGGVAELDAARAWTELGAPKPLVVYVAGSAAPDGKRMGHAGAIIGGEEERAIVKLQVLEEAGAVTTALITDIPEAVVGQLPGIADGNDAAAVPRQARKT